LSAGSLFIAGVIAILGGLGGMESSFIVGGIIFFTLFFLFFSLFIARLTKVTFSTLFFVGVLCSLALHVFVISPVFQSMDILFNIIFPIVIAGSIGWTLSASSKKKMVLMILAVITVLAAVATQINSNTMHQSQQHEYQQAIETLTPDDLILQDSKFENRGIDVGIVMTNTYQTNRDVKVVMGEILQNAHQQGYEIFGESVDTISGYLKQGGSGTIFVTNPKANIIEIKLSNFSKEPLAKPTFYTLPKN
jgi:hypothetical protein